MKFFLAFALIAVASAAPSYKPAIVLGQQAQEIAQIVEAIYSPSTDPATAAALESLLLETLGVSNPISVGPAIVDAPVVSPIHIGAEIVDFPVSPISVGAPVVEAPSVPYPFPTWEPVKPSPVIIGEIPAGAPTPLVQIIVNVNDQASAAVVPGAVSEPIVSGVSVAAPVVPGPVSVAAPVVPGPVSVAAPVSPISVATPVVPSPVSVAAPVAVSPVTVGSPIAVSPVAIGAPIAVSPISVGAPVLPSPAVSLPETLN